MLDPANYYTSPGLSWDALLKKTKVKLELLTDYDMYLMIEKGLRGGISMVSERHAKANNPLVEGYDKSKNTPYIMYLDENNLYGFAMVQNCRQEDSSGWRYPPQGSGLSLQQAPLTRRVIRKDTYVRLILLIRSICMIHTTIIHSRQRSWRCNRNGSQSTKKVSSVRAVSR